MKKMSGLLGSYGEFAISGQDQRINKKTKPVNQAGGPNYLGKAEMVTVPKQWLSSPDHVVAELAYITPAEQKILIDANLYGSLDGKPNRGPGGLMSLQGDMGSIGGDDGNDGSDGGSGGTPGLGGSQDVGSGFAGPTSSPSDTGGGMSPGRSMAEYGTPEFAGRTDTPTPGEIAAVGRAPSSERGFDVKTAKAITDILMAPELGWVDKAALKAYAKGKNMRSFTPAPPGYPGVFSSFQAEQSMPPGLLSAAFDMFGLPTKGFVTTGWGEEAMGEGSEFGGGDGPDTIPAEYNPVTGQQDQCPDGYVFDEDLQACRMSADLPFGTPITTPGPYAAGDYARMGLLDIAPMGMSLFADRYGIPQMDFDTANLAFRRGAATRPQYFRKAPDLTGYTLLA